MEAAQRLILEMQNPLLYQNQKKEKVRKKKKKKLKEAKGGIVWLSGKIWRFTWAKGYQEAGSNDANIKEHKLWKVRCTVEIKKGKGKSEIQRTEDRRTKKSSFKLFQHIRSNPQRVSGSAKPPEYIGANQKKKINDFCLHHSGCWTDVYITATLCS